MIMKKTIQNAVRILLLLLFTAAVLPANAQTVVWGNANSRTESRNDAGLQGNAGALSGFYETAAPVNYPAGAGSWWHLLDVRHSNTANNYAMQFSGSFFDQQLYFRKTSNNPAQAWSRVLLESGGKVGIGTTAPTEALHVVGNIRGTGNLNLPASTIINAPGRLHVSGDEILYILNKSGMVIGKEWGGNGNLSVQGIVLAGPVTATPPGYSLYAATGILTEKVKVALKTSGDWSDHVFNKNYPLLPLQQVEQFIQTNGHLPGVPAAAELVNEGGIDVNKMFAKQMEKIEELTLYIIELNKKTDRLETENNQLKQIISGNKN